MSFQGKMRSLLLFPTALLSGPSLLLKAPRKNKSFNGPSTTTILQKRYQKMVLRRLSKPMSSIHRWCLSLSRAHTWAKTKLDVSAFAALRYISHCRKSTASKVSNSISSLHSAYSRSSTGSTARYYLLAKMQPNSFHSNYLPQRISYFLSGIQMLSPSSTNWPCIWE